MSVEMLLILDFVSESNSDMDSQTIYNTIWKPHISIQKYAHRLYKYIIRSPDILAFTMYYLAMYINNTKIKANQFNIHRLFLTSTTVAHKFWYDDCYENKELAKIAGIQLKELNRLERDFLKGIEWRLYKLQTRITPDEFVQISSQITGLEYNVIKTEHCRQVILQKKKKVARIAKDIIKGIIKDIIYH